LPFLEVTTCNCNCSPLCSKIFCFDLPIHVLSPSDMHDYNIACSSRL
jgi:hypothetical protein